MQKNGTSSCKIVMVTTLRPEAFNLILGAGMFG